MAIKPLQTDQAPLVDTGSGKPTPVFYTWLKQFSEAAIAFFNGSGPAWTAYTPAVTTGSGSITSYTATGRSYQVGKIVFVQFEVDITTNGTGGGSVHVTLPIAANGSFTYVLGGEQAAAPFAVMAKISGSDARVTDTSGGYPGSAGAQIICSGTYEAA